MRYTSALVSALLLLATTACSGGAAAPANTAPRLTALYGTSLQGISLTAANGEAQLHFADPSEAAIVALEFSTPQPHLSWTWNRVDSGVATFTAVQDNCLVVAVMPRDDADPAPLSLAIDATDQTPPTPKPDSRPPGAGGLTAVLNEGQVALSWDEDLPGDYDFDGSVSLEDILPLARACAFSLNQSLESARPWLDGNHDGIVNQADADMLAANLGLSVAGYRVYRNNSIIPGSGPGDCVTSLDTAPDTAPRHYCLTAAGTLDDTWAIVPVDASGQNVGPANFSGGGTLQADIDIEGMDLLPIDDELGKIGTRVILPIENTDDIGLLAPVQVLGNTITANNIPRGRLVLLEITFKPAGYTTASGDGLVRTNVALTIPLDSEDLNVQAQISLLAQPDGGCGLLLSTSTADGNAPLDSAAQLNLTTGILRRDTNDNGSFEDEIAFPDTDRDCISDPLQHQLEEAMTAGVAPAPFRIAGRLQGVDPARGMLTIGAVRRLGAGSALPPLLNLRFAENMRLYDRNGELPRIGELAEVVVYSVFEASGQSYWAGSIHPLASGYLSNPLVTGEPGGTQILTWTVKESFAEYRLVRYSSPTVSYIPGGPFNLGAPNLVENWSRPLSAGTARYVDNEIMPGLSYTYELYGLLAGGEEEYLGLFRSVQ